MKTSTFRCAQGFSVIELLIAMGVLVVILGATVQVFSKQNRLLKDENANTQLRAWGRQAVAEMTKELRRAGYGFPPDQGVTAASANSITFRVNLDNKSTMVLGDVNAGDTGILIAEGTWTDFSAGDKIVLFDARNPTIWESNSVASTANGGVTGDDLTLGTAAANSYQSVRGIILNGYQTVIYQLNGNRVERILDPGGSPVTTTVAGNVNTLTFTYYDINGNATTIPADIQRIAIQLSLLDPVPSVDAALTFTTELDLRNM